MPSAVFGSGYGTGTGSTWIVIHDAGGSPSGAPIRVGDGWHIHKTLPQIIEEGGLSQQDRDRVEAAQRQRVERVYEAAVPFGSSMSSSRLVHLAITALDIPAGASSRLEVTEVFSALDSKNGISAASGFILHVKTWADTRVWSARVSWLAHTI